MVHVAPTSFWWGHTLIDVRYIIYVCAGELHFFSSGSKRSPSLCLEVSLPLKNRAMSYTIHKVATEKDKRTFLYVACTIYSSDQNWICPLDKQLHNIFEPAKNSYYTHGSADRWMLRGANGEEKMNKDIAAGGES